MTEGKKARHNHLRNLLRASEKLREDHSGPASSREPKQHSSNLYGLAYRITRPIHAREINKERTVYEPIQSFQHLMFVDLSFSLHASIQRKEDMRSSLDGP